MKYTWQEEKPVKRGVWKETYAKRRMNCIEMYLNMECAQGRNEKHFIGREPYEIHLIRREACEKKRMKRDVPNAECAQGRNEGALSLFIGLSSLFIGRKTYEKRPTKRDLCLLKATYLMRRVRRAAMKGRLFSYVPRLFS